MSSDDHTPRDDPDRASPYDRLVADRRANLEALRAAGIEHRPVRFPVSHSLAAVREAFGDLPAGSEPGDEVTVAGRVVGKRGHGRLAFLDLREDGAELQLFCRAGDLGEDGMRAVDLLDLGDLVGAEGRVVVTNRGELSVAPRRLVLLAKCLEPWPEKWHGLEDVEQRYRQRELDLAANPDSRRAFEVRTAVVGALRAELDGRGYREVETPMLHPIPGGAAARPFVTHHNALDADLYLRIAPELYLKRLVAGGFPRVYELGRVFRNEGLSTRHNPEFTMLEAYAAYGDYSDMLELTEALVERAARAAAGTLELTSEGRPLSLAAPYARRRLLDLVREATGRADLSYDGPVADLRALCADRGVAVEERWGAGRLVVELYEKLVEPELWEPTFVLDHPVETSPLARRHRSDPHATERFELIVAGRELANAFSELTDPDEQRRRFEAQAAAHAAGDAEAMRVDEAYLRAMRLGMPPMGGLGVGVDRLVMLLADVPNIRDVILFPTLRPEA